VSTAQHGTFCHKTRARKSLHTQFAQTATPTGSCLTHILASLRLEVQHEQRADSSSRKGVRS